MSSFSSWIKTIFIISLAFPLYSQTSLFSPRSTREKPECDAYKDQLHFCPRILDPICASNGKTYANKCVFCSEIENGGTFEFSYYGKCGSA